MEEGETEGCRITYGLQSRWRGPRAGSKIEALRVRSLRIGGEWVARI